MAQYKVVVRKSLSKDLKKVPKKDVERILDAIRRLGGNPRPPQSKKLSGEEKYRLRLGKYRVLYEIHDKELIVCVVKAKHRKDAYK